MKMMAPIPGMSLTTEPGNSPWEQPPLYNTAEESLAFYLNKFNDEEKLDDLLFAFEAGYPVDAMVDFLTSYGVMEGYHSFDVKMLISPILHEYFISLADASGIEYTEELGPSKEEKMKTKDEERAKALLLKSMSMPTGPLPEEDIEQAEEMLEDNGGDTEDDEEEDMSSPIIKRRM
jgi:hypothetical protein